MLARRLTEKISWQLLLLYQELEASPQSPQQSVEKAEMVFEILGLEDLNTYTEISNVLQLSLAKIADADLQQSLNDEVANLATATGEKVEELFKLLRNNDYLKPNQFPLDELNKVINEFNANADRWGEIEAAINASVYKRVKKNLAETVENAVEEATASKLDEIEVTEGKKVIIDVDNAQPAEELTVDKSNKPQYKAYLIRTAKSLAAKQYHFEWMRRRDFNNIVDAMELSGSDLQLFTLAYRRSLNKAAPRTIGAVAKEKIAVKYANLKTAIKGEIGNTAGKIFDRADIYTANIGARLKLTRRRKKGETGILKAATKVLGDIINNVQGKINKVTTFVKGTRLVRTLGTLGSVGGKSTAVAGAAFGGGGKGMLVGSGLAVVTGLGFSPAGIAIIGTTAAVGAASEAILASKPLAEVLTNRGFARAANTMNRVAALERFAKFTNPAMNGGFIGGIAGGLLIGGPLGAALGAVVAGGVGVAYKASTDAVTNRILAGRTFGTATKIPFAAMSSQVDANLWAQTVVKMGLSDTFIGKGLATALDAVGAEKYANNIRSIQVSEAERTFYDPRRISTKNPLPLAMNTLGLGAFIFNPRILLNPLGLLGILRSMGIARFAPALYNRILISMGLTESLLKTGGQAATAAVVGSRAATIMKGASVGSIVGTVVGIAIASVLGFNIGIGAAIGGTIGTVIGGIGALGAASTGVGALGSAAIVGGSTTLGTVAGAFVDTHVFNKMPKMMNPLVLIQGMFDVLKLFNMRITSLKDYGEFAIVVIGLINFLVFIYQFSGAPSTQKSGEVKDSNTAIIFTTETTTYSQDYKTLNINSTRPGNYTFSNVDRILPLDGDKIAFVEGDNYWVVTNPGKYVYDEKREVFVGKGQDIRVAIYEYNRGENLTSAGNPQTSNDTFVPISFCDLYFSLCD